MVLTKVDCSVSHVEPLYTFHRLLYNSKPFHGNQNKQGLKRVLFNRTRHCNIQIFNKIIFLK